MQRQHKIRASDMDATDEFREMPRVPDTLESVRLYLYVRGAAIVDATLR